MGLIADGEQPKETMDHSNSQNHEHRMNSKNVNYSMTHWKKKMEKKKIPQVGLWSYSEANFTCKYAMNTSAVKKIISTISHYQVSIFLLLKGKSIVHNWTVYSSLFFLFFFFLKMNKSGVYCCQWNTNVQIKWNTGELKERLCSTLTTDENYIYCCSYSREIQGKT